MNKALFEAGETVRTYWVGESNFDRIEIESLEWFRDAKVSGFVSKKPRSPHTGWVYALVGFKGLAMESSLRKLPPPADCSFSEMIEQLNEKETA